MGGWWGAVPAAPAVPALADCLGPADCALQMHPDWTALLAFSGRLGAHAAPANESKSVRFDDGSFPGGNRPLGANSGADRAAWPAKIKRGLDPMETAATNDCAFATTSLVKSSKRARVTISIKHI